MLRGIPTKARLIEVYQPDKALERLENPSTVTWQAGCAEQIPLADGAVDGAISQLSLHHFQDRDRAFLEMDRVVGHGLAGKGPLVFSRLMCGTVSRFGYLSISRC